MNSRMKVVAALVMIFALGTVFSGCNGGKLPIGITLSPSGTQNAVAGQAVNITSTVANDPKAAGVMWESHRSRRTERANYDFSHLHRALPDLSERDGHDYGDLRFRRHQDLDVDDQLASRFDRPDAERHANR